MVINYGCVKLRAIEEEDFDLLLYLINAPEIECMTVGWHLPISRKEQKNWMENYTNSDKSIKLMIELTNSKTIGVISLENIDWKNRTAVVGCKIKASLKERIKGDTLDALKGIIKYAFDELGMNCLYTVILENNILSQNLCKRAGFCEEGILRKRVYQEGKFKDLVSFSLLKDEVWRNQENE